MDSSAIDYRARLRELGLTLDISVETARRIWGKLLEIEGARGTAKYDRLYQYTMVRDAYDAIAEEIVTTDTPDEVIEQLIPKVLEGFGAANGWNRHMLGMTPPSYTEILRPQVTIWQGRKLQMEPRIATPPQISVPTRDAGRDLPTHIESLRIEADVTQNRLAELVGLDLRTVQRHCTGDTTPNPRYIKRYERAFSKLLNRQVVVGQMP
jgi:DNA-binding XRE family transcriptional regulator